jgi:RNA polymerase sigma-70 factor (ECF subfamily)
VAALRCFERSHLAGVPRALAHLRLGPAELDEVLQELRHKLFVAVAPARPKIHDYAGRGSLVVWVRAAAVRTALNLLAQPQQRERPFDDALLDRASAGNGPLRSQNLETLFMKQRDREGVQAAFRAVLARLDGPQRTLLRLHYLDGLSLGEIGTLQHVHKATISRRLRQLEEHIAGALRQELGVTLQLPAAEAESLIQLVLSQLDQSLAGLLGDPAM